MWKTVARGVFNIEYIREYLCPLPGFDSLAAGCYADRAIAAPQCSVKSNEFVGRLKKSAPERYLTDMHLANNDDWHVSSYSHGATGPCYAGDRPTGRV